MLRIEKKTVTVLVYIQKRDEDIKKKEWRPKKLKRILRASKVVEWEIGILNNLSMYRIIFWLL